MKERWNKKRSRRSPEPAQLLIACLLRSLSDSVTGDDAPSSSYSSPPPTSTRDSKPTTDSHLQKFKRSNAVAVNVSVIHDTPPAYAHARIPNPRRWQLLIGTWHDGRVLVSVSLCPNLYAQFQRACGGREIANAGQQREYFVILKERR